MPKTGFLLPMLAFAIWLTGLAGCGTTRLTNTARSASEEMLLSHAIDRAVGKLDLAALAGHSVFLDTTNLGNVTFSEYLTGALRQHLLASGARLASDPEEAQLVVEARAGSVATAQHETLVGLPQATVPANLIGIAGTLPEIAIIKQTMHIGVAKVGVFAYRTDNGAGVWQSGMQENQSTHQSSWYIGIGPIQSGDVVIDGGSAERGGVRRSDASSHRASLLESELWTGEMPPAKPWPGPPTPAREENETEVPETSRPDVPEEIPAPDEFWQFVSPVVVSPQ